MVEGVEQGGEIWRPYLKIPSLQLYIYANLPLCEFTAQARGREASCPPQAQIFRVAAILPLLLK